MLSIILSIAITASTPIISKPPITEVHRAAIRYAELDQTNASKWERNSKLQALLPRLQVEYERRMRDNINIDINDTVYVGNSGIVVGPGEDSYTRDSIGDQNVTVKAIWMLNELIFNRDQLDISAENRSRHRERQLLLAEVNKHYYKRLKLIELSNLESKKKNSKVIFIQNQIAINEETATLDALTGGWFSKHLEVR